MQLFKPFIHRFSLISARKKAIFGIVLLVLVVAAGTVGALRYRLFSRADVAQINVVATNITTQATAYPNERSLAKGNMAIYALYQVSSGGPLMLKTSTTNGNSWGAIATVDNAVTFGGHSIFVDPGIPDTIHITWEDNSGANIYYIKYTFDSKTLTRGTVRIISAPAAPQKARKPSIQRSGDKMWISYHFWDGKTTSGADVYKASFSSDQDPFSNKTDTTIFTQTVNGNEQNVGTVLLDRSGTLWALYVRPTGTTQGGLKTSTWDSTNNIWTSEQTLGFYFWPWAQNFSATVDGNNNIQLIGYVGNKGLTHTFYDGTKWSTPALISGPSEQNPPYSTIFSSNDKTYAIAQIYAGTSNYYYIKARSWDGTKWSGTNTAWDITLDQTTYKNLVFPSAMQNWNGAPYIEVLYTNTTDKTVQFSKLSLMKPTSKIVTVSGTSKDPNTGKPITAATITLGAEKVDPVQTLTDSSGNYKLTLGVDTADPAEQTVGISQEKEGILDIENDGGNSNQYFLDIPNTTSQTVGLSQNFNRGPVPIDWTPLTGDDACPVQANVVFGAVIKGVTFCSLWKDQYLFDKYPVSIQKMADTVNDLRSATGHNEIPKSVNIGNNDLSVKICGGARYACYSSVNKIYIPEIRFDLKDQDYSYILNTLTHEFGHGVDRAEGFSTYGFNLSALWLGCFDSNFFTISCPASSKESFRSAFYVVRKSDALISVSYARSRPREMFAELFEGSFRRESDGSLLPLTNVDSVRSMIENFLLFSRGFSFDSTGSSFFPVNSGGTTIQQNALMFIWKFVANKSHQDEYFPGSIETYASADNLNFGFGYDDIAQGRYMSTGVISLRVFDHAKKPMENTLVTLGGTEGILTRTGDQDPYLNGTAVRMDVQPDSRLLGIFTSSHTIDIPRMPNYYQGAVWLGQKVNIIQGSNPVIELKFRLHKDSTFKGPLQDNTPYTPAIGATGKYTSNTNGRVYYPIAKGQMTRYPDIGTPGGVVDDGDYLITVVGGDSNRTEEFNLPSWASMKRINLKSWDINEGAAILFKGQTCTWDFANVVPGGDTLHTPTSCQPGS